MNLSSHDEIGLMLNLLPDRIRVGLEGYNLDNLIEIVLDLNRIPEARFFGETIDLGSEPITAEDLDSVRSRLQFGDDNRAGIPDTLHRISCIRDRYGVVVGLTCRVGRVIYGTASIIQDLLTSGRSILMLGRPGLGKTTRLRDAARMLSVEYGRRVIIVDTSNEIAGDGQTPHHAIGRSRRMQVPSTDLQAKVMLEAVENHTPEIIVIDEIGDRRDVEAARTIAERGVQLIATAHGYTVGSIVDNPVLSDLVGGCQTVILGDEEAKKRGCPKSVVERKHSATFDVIVEIIDFDTMAVYPHTEYAIDAYLSKSPVAREVRKQCIDGVQITVESSVDEDPAPLRTEEPEEVDEPADRGLMIFPVGLSRNSLRAVLNNLDIKATIVSKIEKAQLILCVQKRMDAVAGYKGKADKIIVQSNSQRAIGISLASYMK